MGLSIASYAGIAMSSSKVSVREPAEILHARLRPNRQIRRLVLYVHAVVLSAVCAAQVRCQIQPDRHSPIWCWLVD